LEEESYSLGGGNRGIRKKKCVCQGGGEATELGGWHTFSEGGTKNGVFWKKKGTVRGRALMKGKNLGHSSQRALRGTGRGVEKEG